MIISEFEKDLRELLNEGLPETLTYTDTIGAKISIGDYFTSDDEDGMVVQFFSSCVIDNAPSDKELGFSEVDITYEEGVIVAFVSDEAMTTQYEGEVMTVDNFVKEFELTTYMNGRIQRLLDSFKSKLIVDDKTLDELSSRYFNRYAIDNGIYDKPKAH